MCVITPLFLSLGFSGLNMSNSLANLSDQLLLEKYRVGDTMAFNVLFKRYFDGIKGFAMKNVRDSFVAEELAMDVMMGLWKNKGQVDVKDNLKPYLFRAVKNALYNHYRKKALATVNIELLTESQAQGGNAADHNLQVRELHDLYNQQLEKLSPQKRKVYEMSRLENKTYGEIAEDLNLSVNTVENYMVASLAFFRKQLKDRADLTIGIFIFFHLF